jgi:MFS family permease
MVLSGAVEGTDPVLTRIVDEDNIPWYKKPNLRSLYFLLFPTCMGIEITSGFDSQLINTAQGINAWKKCQYMTVALGWLLTLVDFGHAVTDPKTLKVSYALAANYKGIVAAAYSLGAICALPFVPTFSQKFGRRWAIFFGSAVSIVGAILQGCAQNGTLFLTRVDFHSDIY